VHALWVSSAAVQGQLCMRSGCTHCVVAVCKVCRFSSEHGKLRRAHGVFTLHMLHNFALWEVACVHCAMAAPNVTGSRDWVPVEAAGWKKSFLSSV